MAEHLRGERSPYLQMHVDDPVDWYPWGEEAFAKAQSEQKPIFLSIGYATCHWCHVMAEESFKNPEIAKALNEVFVCIKVDREELPEVDSLYMELASALMSAHAGWPLNVVLTPDLLAFFAVTYLPPKGRHGLVGMDQFIKEVRELWASDARAEITQQAGAVVEELRAAMQVKGSDLPNENHLTRAVETLFEMADPVYGGMKGDLKFPMAYQVEFFLSYGKTHADSRALFFADLTLDRMHRGGIYDQLAGGFARYAVDPRWEIPHFEKMLLDNALLASSYLDGSKILKKDAYRRVCQETLDSTIGQLKGAEGGFYSAEDADVQGKEGEYYTWSFDELASYPLFCSFYGVSKSGNFEGRNVLHVPLALEEFAKKKGLAPQEVELRLSEDRKALLAKRRQREQPRVDRKVLVKGCGFMVDALARASLPLDRPDYLTLALETASFIEKNLWKENHLHRRFIDQEVRYFANLEETASWIRACITLFELNAGTHYLEWAIQMIDTLERCYKAKEGAFYQTEEKDAILLRKVDFYDGSEPSGNALHAENLVRLYQITHKERYLTQAEDVFKAALSTIMAYPPGSCYHLLALLRYLDHKAPTIVIALNDTKALQKEIAQALSRSYLPHGAVIWRTMQDARLMEIVPSLREQGPLEGKTTVYLCRQGVCETPLTDLQEILKAIESL